MRQQIGKLRFGGVGRQARFFLAIALVLSAVLAPWSGPAQGALVDTFDPPDLNVTATQANTAPPLSIESGGPTNNFLRLITDGENNQRNHYSYDLTDPGAFATIAAQFDFAGFSADQPADGLAVLWVPTSIYGISGMGPDSFNTPNFGGTFGLGFQTHPGSTNNVTMHWNGTTLSTGNVPMASASFRNGEFNRVNVTIQQMGAGSNVKVDLVGDVHNISGSGPRPGVTALNQYVSGFLPYESRMQFSGRSGGANMTIDLDNIDVQYSNPYVAPPTISANTMLQDFDSLGTTGFTAVQGNAGSTPGPLAMSGGPTGNYLRLVHDPVGGQSNRIGFDRARDGGVSNTMTADFDFRANSAGAPADGFSIVFLPTAAHGHAGAGPDFTAEEPNVAGALGIGFDLHEAPLNEVSVHWNGGVIAANNLDLGNIDLDAGVFHGAQVVARHVAGGSEVTVTLTPDVHGSPGTPVTVFSDLFVPGMTPYDYRVQFAGRTGGLYHSADLDNIRTGVVAAAAPTAGGATLQDFDGGGAGYKAFSLATGGSYDGTAPKPSIETDAGNSFLRMLSGATWQHHMVGFDQTAAGSYEQVSANFDMRIGTGADGAGFALLSTAHYGTGSLDAALALGESPNATNSLGVGFAIYPNRKDVSLHWNGSQVAIVNSPLDFRNMTFHDIDLNVAYVPGGANVSLNIAGTPIYTNHFIAGMFPYESRLALSGRTGGATTTLDFDNVNVQFQSVLPTGPFHWLPVNDSYTNPAGWQGNVVPSGSDHAVIAQGVSNSNNLNIAGTGSLTVSHAGTLNNGGALRVGAGGTAGEMIQTGGAVQSAGDFYIADGGSSGSTYTMSGGTLTVGGTHSVVGRGGVGHFIQNGGAVNLHRLFVSEFGGSAGSTYTLNDGTLTLNNSSDLGMQVGRSEEGSFNQHGGTVTVDHRVHLGQDSGAVGTYNMTAGDLTMGRYLVLGSSGTGIFNQSGGTVTQTGTRLIFGDQTGGQGTYNMSGGTLTTPELDIADKGGTSGTFNISGTAAVTIGGLADVGRGGTGEMNLSGGTVNIGGEFRVGANGGSSGELNLSGGTLTVNNQISVGYNGNGTALQTGGTLTAGDRLHVGHGAGSTASYEMGGGQINLTGNHLIAGVSGNGTFTQDGGTVTQTAGSIFLADNAGAQGTYNLNGGSLSTTGELRVGNRDTGVFNMTAGTAATGNALRLAPLAGGDGTFHQSGGTVTVGGRFEMTDNAAGTSAYNLSGDGVLTAGGDYFIVGRQGPGHFHQSGDSEVNINVSQRVLVADNAGSGGSTYTMAGGTLNINNGREMSIGKGGTGLFTQSSGTVNASGNIRLGEGADSGTYQLQDGMLNVATVLRGPGGAFEFTGGTLQVGTFGESAQPFDLDQEGGTLAPGSSIGTSSIYGNYNQAAAGTLEIEIAGLGDGGTDYDLVDVYGDASLAGWLDVVLLGGFEADLGDSFDVLTTTGGLDFGGLEVIGDPPNSVFGWWEVAGVPNASTGGSTLRLMAVPEPTTAMLTLLALAGLFVCLRPRRRR